MVVINLFLYQSELISIILSEHYGGKMDRATLTITTHGKSLIDITPLIQNELTQMSGSEGLLHLFIHHTSASLLITENADSDVLVDLERYFAHLVPDGFSIFTHTAEGDDDMSAHIRSALTQTSLMIPIEEKRLQLGIWQGIFLWEHRLGKKRRRLTLSLIS